MPEVCLVVPCYNEADRLRGGAIVDCLRRHPRLTICLVNDGSGDTTAEVLEALRSAHPDRILVLNLPTNGGKAEAVRQGSLHAATLNRYELTGYWDADLSTPLEELEHMLVAFAAHPGCQMAMGSRMKRLGANVERKAVRHILGRIFSTLASLILDLPVYDSQCGAKLFRTELTGVLFRDRFVSRWLFDVELLARLRNHLGRTRLLASTIEVPLNVWTEVGGSKIRLADFVRVPFELMRIRARYNAASTAGRDRNAAAGAPPA